MKMRKILSFVLVLSLVLGSFSMAFAANPSGLSDIVGIANENAIQVNNDLGIIKGFPDGSFKPEQLVNRAEFAAMITRALAVPESALAGYTSTSFKDTAGYGWAVPYLAFAQSKGIMIGDGMGNAMPGRTINVNEAMTMVLRALGYVNHSAELVGTWPANYVTVAQNVGLYDDVAAAFNVDRASAAQIIYNALTVQKVAVNADGETKYLTLTGSTSPAVLLNTGLGCDTKADQIAGAMSEEWTNNVYKFLGAKGTAYIKDKKVVAFTIDSTAKTGKVNSTGTKFTVDGKDYEFKTATVQNTAVKTFENGKAVTDTTLSAITGTALVTINGDFSGSYITEMDSIVYWNVDNAAYVTDADVKDITDKKFMGESFVKDDDKNIDMNSFLLVGAKSLNDIKKGDLAYVYKKDGKIVKIAIGTGTVTGKVTDYDAPDFTVAGKDYTLAADAKVKAGVTFKTTSFNQNDMGKDVTLKLDAFGFVYEIKSAASTDKYAVVKALKIDSFEKKVRAYTATAKDDQTLDLTNDAATSLTPAAAGTLFAYSVDKDGKIDSVDKQDKVLQTATFTGVRTVNIAGTSYTIPDDAVIFAATGANLDSNIELSSMSKITLGTVTTVSAITDGNKVLALLVDAGVADKAGDDVYAVINTVTLKYNADEDDTFKFVKGFINGAAFEKFTATKTTAVTAGAFEVAKIVYDGDGYIKSAVAESPDFGPITYAKLDIGTSTTVLNNTYTISNNAVVYEYDSADEKFTVSNVNAIRGTVNVYETDKDVDGYDIVIFVK